MPRCGSLNIYAIWSFHRFMIFIKRRKFLAVTSFIFFSCPFFSFLYGILWLVCWYAWCPIDLWSSVHLFFSGSSDWQFLLIYLKFTDSFFYVSNLLLNSYSKFLILVTVFFISRICIWFFSIVSVLLRFIESQSSYISLNI